MNFEQFGIMTEPSNTYDGSIYNLHDYMEYCRKIGKHPIELTDEEKKQFEVNPIEHKAIA